MQTKLRTTSLIFAASLLSASMISAASHAKTRTVKKESHFVGIASWYGHQHQGLKMANGKRFDRRKMTAASWYVPLGTVLRVVNLENGRVGYGHGNGSRTQFPPASRSGSLRSRSQGARLRRKGPDPGAHHSYACPISRNTRSFIAA